MAFCRSVYGTTPMGDVVDIEGGPDAGLPDVLAFPDLNTIHLCREPGVAHVIAGVYNPDGSPSGGKPTHGAEAGDTAIRRAGHAADRWTRNSSSTF